MENQILVKFENKNVKVTLAGRLDGTNAPILQEELKKLIGNEIENIVFIAKDLEYISSAGLRVIIFAKQKLGADSKLFLIQPQETVVDVFKMSGLQNFMTVQDSFED